MNLSDPRTGRYVIESFSVGYGLHSIGWEGDCLQKTRPIDRAQKWINEMAATGFNLKDLKADNPLRVTAVMERADAVDTRVQQLTEALAEIRRLRAVPNNKVQCGGDGCPGCPWCLAPSTSPDEVRAAEVNASPQGDA